MPQPDNKLIENLKETFEDLNNMKAQLIEECQNNRRKIDELNGSSEAMETMETRINKKLRDVTQKIDILIARNLETRSRLINQ